MLKALIFEDEIQIYFDRVCTLAEGESYVLYMDGREAKSHGETLSRLAELGFAVLPEYKILCGSDFFKDENF